MKVGVNLFKILKDPFCKDLQLLLELLDFLITRIDPVLWISYLNSLKKPSQITKGITK